MTDPKPVKMWAGFAPYGVVLGTITRNKGATIEAMRDRCLYQAPGYTIRRVTITPDHESEKNE